MATETFAIQSNLPPGEAFARVVDLLRVVEWDRGIRDARHVGGEPGTVGARYDVTVKGFDGKPTTATYELTAVEVPHRFTMVGSHPDFRADDTVSFDPTEGGCRVTYQAGLVLLGDDPPLTDTQLDALFSSVVAVPRDGLSVFLNS